MNHNNFILPLCCVLLASLPAFAQTGTPEKVYARLADVPLDGKVHAVAPIRSLQSSVRVRGFSYGAVVPEGELKGETFAGILVAFIHTKNKDIKTLFRLDMMLLPAESPRQFYKLYFDHADARKAWVKIDDARRIGRNWRDAGLTNEKKELSVDITAKLKLTLSRIALDERITPTLTYTYTDKSGEKQISHSFVNFSEFSEFVDWFQKFLAWADQERARG